MWSYVKNIVKKRVTTMFAMSAFKILNECKCCICKPYFALSIHFNQILREKKTLFKKNFYIYLYCLNELRENNN